ncbi:hypothetical protein [Rhizobium chutanense]|uniref:hypothetical protein n=1 Tax=Rhizobium chutanense TaxID=2035448 RepID=UPI0013DFF2E2|nr:hypothetical protein [Rhizobium chutanense]
MKILAAVVLFVGVTGYILNKKTPRLREATSAEGKRAALNPTPSQQFRDYSQTRTVSAW